MNWVGIIPKNPNYYCSWLHTHMMVAGGRPGKAAAVTGFTGVQRPNR
jgi:hypothetical protein